MASFFANRSNTNVSIPETLTENGVIYYVLQVEVGDVKWTVHHRYSDFYELHTKLVSDHGVSKDTIPPKKLIRKNCPDFVSQRREALEVYMKTVLNYLIRALPLELAVFLDFHRYETNYLLQDLALQYFVKGESFLSSIQVIEMSPLQLYAISQRLVQPCPELDMDKCRDFSHVLDICFQTSKLHVVGSSSAFGTSNIIPNKLCFELSSFKALKELKITNLEMKNIIGLGSLRETLRIFTVERTESESISDILFCDSIHKTASASSQQNWNKLAELNLSDNRIKNIDESVKCLPNLTTLIINQNQLRETTNLAHLSNLTNLYLSANLFQITDNLHTKLGNLIHLDFSANYIKTLAGFSKLYSLEFLDISSNQVASIDEVRHIGHLPCLENLRLTGNPVSVIIDYRVKVLEQFGTRANELCLDNEMPSQTELDTICILQAIRIVKEGKTPTLDGTENSSLFILNTSNSSS